jgi:uncharacterized protein
MAEPLTSRAWVAAWLNKADHDLETAVCALHAGHPITDTHGLRTGTIAPMRLNAAQTRTILQCVRQQFGSDARVMLFGSRLDDAARGGDVDLLVESDAPATLRQRALATMALEQALNLPVDIVAVQRGVTGSAFARIARSRAQTLENPA